MPIGDRLGGFFDSLGGIGSIAVFSGAMISSAIHGLVMGAVTRKWIAKDPANPTAAEMDKGDLLTTGIMSVLPAAFGVARITTYSSAKGYDSDVLDTIGCILGGAFTYEIGSAFEVATAMVAGGE